MTINIVVKEGWILERLARELAAQIPGVMVNAGAPKRRVDQTADLTYYLPAKDIRKFPTDGRAIGFYTHGENGFDQFDKFEACVAMNQTMAATLRARGVSDVTVIRPGTEAPTRPIMFGVIGRVYNDGRKGEALVLAAVEAGFSFVACGRPIMQAARGQWPCTYLCDVDERETFYQAIDYLVVTSTMEGGPMPVLEAIARGVPVIAPNVGWCWEFPVIRYAAGSWASLRAVLEGLTRPPTWQAWVEGHRALFARLAVERAA